MGDSTVGPTDVNNVFLFQMCCLYNYYFNINDNAGKLHSGIVCNWYMSLDTLNEIA